VWGHRRTCFFPRRTGPHKQLTATQAPGSQRARRARGGGSIWLCQWRGRRKPLDPSEQGEREGEAPSGSASGGGDASPHKIVSEPLIEINEVSKSYRRDRLEIPVLRDISLTVPNGEYLALMGPSGSGKTTLLNLIAGIDQPDRGKIRVAGNEIGQMDESALALWRSRHVGFIFQLYNLIPVLTAFENVELPLLLTSLTRKQRREHAELALRVVGLTDRRDHYPRQLSGGQEQRVAIARAIVTDPTILVADEPTGDLDKASAFEILDLLERLNTDFAKTIVMVTHDPRAAERARVVRQLDKGTLI